MNFTSAGSPGAPIHLPLWVWFLALAAGGIVAAASLSYAPGGRINLLWVWLLWAGLPLLGCLVSLRFLLMGRARPWLFRWRDRTLRWYPNAEQRLHMLWLLQCFWLLMGLGMLLGFWLLLLMTDLAFGWSSTVLDDERALLSLLQALALPWRALWPEAVPTADLMTATRYIRIDDAASQVERTGDWWRFLMASLVCYNLVPRALLGLVTYGRWRGTRRSFPLVSVTGLVKGPEPVPSSLAEAPLAEWRDAYSLPWELPQVAEGYVFGQGPWEEDKRALDEILARGAHRLLWRVNASRSPVAELSDLIQLARERGASEQALLAVPDAGTRRERHIASWRRFCQRQRLTWIIA